MKALPTSHDVARLAGVSQPTVSRALRDDPSVAAPTRERVRTAAVELGYVPSQRGRSLSTRRTGHVGLVVTDLANPFFLQVLEIAHAALADHDSRLLVLTHDGDDGALLQRLLDGSLDGVLLASTRLDSQLPAALAARAFPFVLVNRAVDDAPGDVCVVDNAAGARLAAEELLALGHTRIAAIHGPPETSTGRDRAAGFSAALKAAGHRPDPKLVLHVPFDFTRGRQSAQALLGHGATALFCANDVLALGALDALHAARVPVPEAMSVIGFDDIAMAGWDVFSLTTVSQDLPRLVRRAVELLTERIEGRAPAQPQRVVLEPRLVRRGTHGPPQAGVNATGSASTP